MSEKSVRSDKAAGEPVLGRIVRGIGGLYYAETLQNREGRQIVRCLARGAFRHESISPEVGDLVEIESKPEGDSLIRAILPRKNLLIRPPMANLDRLYVAVPSTHPEPDLRTVDKLTAIAVHNGIEPVIVITKAGLDRSHAEQIAAIYRKTTFPVYVTDSLSQRGIDELRADFEQFGRGKISAFAGASGVGKSTLINTLFEELALETGEVSAKTERGRHTTRKVELYPVGEGYLADTPGFTMLDFRRFDFFAKEDLPDAFPELAPYLGKCRYTGCTHCKEEGCAVLAAVERGEIAPSRQESYRELYDVLKEKHAWDKRR